MPTSKDNSLVPIILAFLAIYVIWGSTYLFIAMTVESIPPFLLSAIRFTLASTLLFSLAWSLKKYQTVSWKQVRNAALA
ncbi:MAG: EamA family transporter, partial [Bacteroidota bacterium]